MRNGLTTEGGEKVALLGVAVRAEIVAGHAEVVVQQRYRNDEAVAVESVYTFPLPTRALLTGFSMEVAGRRCEGEVHERDEAFKRYDDAIVAGHGGALLEQERPNVFTANVGNLLPGEETVIEVTFVEPLAVEEGGVRWSLPTLVAPRYAPAGVTDAERVSPEAGNATYGLTVDAVFDLGAAVLVESPSHEITTAREGEKTRAKLARTSVALDRDVVFTAVPESPVEGPVALTTAVCHRPEGSGTGTFALTLVPDLGADQRARNDVVFLLDRSGSMGGAAMTEALTALRLCLRQLREGDRFAILAFDNVVETFAPELVPFDPRWLAEADVFLAQIGARGGTELLSPLMHAARLAPDGIVVLLTDGQVANEDQILASYLDQRKTARVYSFGIGTNVSDALLQGLADRTGGAVESIHPGERIDEKVIAQFSRATAARVTDVTIKLDGADVGELAPAKPRALVDGEAYAVFGTYDAPGGGVLTVRGKHAGEDFFLEAKIVLDERSEHPTVERLWAQARIRDLEQTITADKLGDRRVQSMKERVVALAKKHRVSSRFTSFVVVEQRTGDRRTNAQPERRVVPVAMPAGSGMASRARAPMPAPMMPMMARAMSIGAPPPPAAAMPAPSPARGMAPPGSSRPSMARAPKAMPPMPAASAPAVHTDRLGIVVPGAGAAASEDPVHVLLGRQGAGGLWDGPDPVLATARALLELFDLGITATHAVHGALVKKAIEAVLAAPPSASRALALGVAWLLASGRRTRDAIALAAQAHPGLALGDEAEVRARIATP